MKILSLVRPTFLAFGLCALAACLPPPQPDPTRYFVLTGPAPAPTAGGAASADDLRIGLQSVELAKYLKSPDLIVRQGTNELVLQDYARWAEPLDAGIARLLRERLQAVDGVGQIYLQPFPLDANRDYDVAVTVLRCEGATTAGGDHVARFAATIEITTTGDHAHLVTRRTFVAPEAKWDGKDFARLAGLLSADVEALGQEVASALPNGSSAL
jgi:uncharacterized lipoprotein YmbA